MAGSESRAGAVAEVPAPPAGSDELVRRPRQERSRRTLESILEAGLELLEAEGPEGLTVTGITRRAGTSVGSFYARFDGKDDLIRYLGERALEQTLEAWEGVGTGASDGELREGADRMVRALGGLHLDGPGRALALLAGQEDPPPTRRLRFEARLARDLRALGSASELRAELAARIVVGLLHDVARHRGPAAPEGEEAVLPEPEALLSELVELLVGYLGGAQRAPEKSPARGPGEGPEEAEAGGDEEPGPEPDAPDPFEIWE